MKINQIIFLILFLVGINLSVNSQSISPKNATSSTICDGGAMFNDSYMYNSWSWYSDSLGLIKNGGDTISNLCPGSYYLEYKTTDTSASKQKYFIINYGSDSCNLQLFIIPSPTATGACTGSASIGNIIGGTAPYTYLWSTNPPSTTQTISNLCLGSYSLTITDSKACTIVRDFYIAQDTSSTDTCNIQAYIAPTPTETGACTGSASIGNIMGGTAPYMYNWSNSSTTQSISNLCSGDYSVTITDSKACTVVRSFYIAQDTSSTDTCNIQTYIIPTSIQQGGCTGSASVGNITGGTAPFTFIWSNSSTTQTISNLCSGGYSVTITDSKACSIVREVYIAQDSSSMDSCNIQAYVMPSPTQSGACTGSASINNITGGTAPYMYIWSNSSTTQTISNLCSGGYSVTITDSKACTAVRSIYIAQDSTGNNPCLKFYANATATSSTEDSCIGTANINVSNGTAPYTYNWSNSSTNKTLYNLCPGAYYVTITDANNCSVAKSIYVMQDSVYNPCKGFAVTLYKNNSVNDSCSGLVGSYLYGGTAGYTYIWSNSRTTESINGLCKGNYKLTVTDANSCVAYASIYVGQDNVVNPLPLTVYAVAKDETSNGNCDGAVKIVANGGVPPYTYNHSDSYMNLPYASNLCVGYYGVTVTDNQANSVEASYLVSTPANTVINPNNELKDSVIVDTIATNLTEKCDIDYSLIDSVKIQSFSYDANDTVSVTWAVYIDGTPTIITQYYYIDGQTGVYTVVLSLYCDNVTGHKTAKGVANFIKANDQIYYQEESNLGINDKCKIENTIPEINVYPIPFNDYIQINTGKIENSIIRIYDINGKLILTEKNNSNKININLSYLPKGQYILSVQNDNYCITKKLVK